jgi:predicted nuclease of restriction endonuclease-like (RecB) superfamily
MNAKQKQSRTQTEIVQLLVRARQDPYHTDERKRIDLYWKVGAAISRRIEQEGWGKGTVATLADQIQRAQPSARGFSPQNLWRMRQFFDAYREAPELATLARQVSWSSNLHIIGKAKRAPERAFYLRMAARHGWQVREVARHIDAALFERQRSPKAKSAPSSKRKPKRARAELARPN